VDLRPMECVFGGFCRLCYGLGASWWCQRRCTPQGLARQWAWTPGGVHGFLVDGFVDGPTRIPFWGKGSEDQTHCRRAKRGDEKNVFRGC
jgi:hypothetical protein